MKNILLHSKIFIIVLPIILLFNPLVGQDEWYEVMKDTELNIPSSPAFAMMGVNPEMVLRPSDLRSFKVDWRIKNYNLAPDLAIEGQPLWHLLYKKRSWSDIAKMSDWEKRLSTLSLSLGTAKIDGINHAAYSVKINLYKKEDHLFNKSILHQMQEEHTYAFIHLNAEMDSLIAMRNAALDEEERMVYNNEIDRVRYEIRNINNVLKDQYRLKMEEYQKNHWNRTMVDGAFGMVYTYDNGGIDSLKVKSAGIAFWVNGCLQIGYNGLLTGLLRYTGINNRSNVAIGTSYRYGGPKFNFYAEVVYERLGNYFDRTLDAPFAGDEYFAAKFEQDIGNGWFHYNSEGVISQYTIAYGGDFKLSRNILLNFAIRTQFSQDFQLNRLIPVANVVCLMK